MPSKSRYITKKLAKIDVFGQPINLYLDGQPQYKTSIGGFFTVCTILLVLAAFITSLITLFAYNLTSSHVTTTYYNDPPPMALNRQNFMFSIGLEDTSILLNASIFNYFMTRSVITADGQTQEEIPMKICEYSDYPGFEAEFDNYNLNQTLCPDSDEYDIQGAYESDVFSYIKINITKCENNTNKLVTCAPEKEISKYFAESGKIRIQLYFLNHIVNALNHSNPILAFIDDLAWIASPSGTLVQSTDMYLRSTTVNTQDNLLGIGDGINETAIEYGKDREDHNYVPSKPVTEYVSIYFRSAFYGGVVYRKYQVFTDVLSFIGGIWNILFLVLGFAAAYFNKLLYHIDLSNVLYEFDTSGGKVEKVEVDNDIEMMKQQSIADNKRITKKESLAMANVSLKERIKTKFQEMKQNRSELKYSLKEMVCGFCACLKRQSLKAKLLKVAVRNITKDIDVREILKRLQEIEKLKKTLLTPAQLAIFNFVPPPIIVSDEEENKNFERKISEHVVIDKTTYNIHDYYHKYKDFETLKKSEDEFSKNLLHQLDEQSRAVFEAIEKNINFTKIEITEEGDQSGSDPFSGEDQSVAKLNKKMDPSHSILNTSKLNVSSSEVMIEDKKDIPSEILTEERIKLNFKTYFHEHR